MKEVTLEDITQEDFDSAAAAVASGVRAYNRKLDVRAGTVLRDLLVDPESAIEGVISAQTEEVIKVSSLKRMNEAQKAGETIDQDDVESVISNFNMTPAQGKPSRGVVKIVVSDDSVSYSVSEGAQFRTADEIYFTAESAVDAVSARVTRPGVVKNAELYDGAAGFFFLVPVVAQDSGASGNIQQGTAIFPVSPVYSFVSAEAYKDFDGGSDSQTLEKIIEDIPSSLSIRGFVNKTAAEGMLRAEFDEGDFPIVSVSSVGYGNVAQRRDSHNPFGVGVGGRVDLYVRNFGDLFSITKTVKGSLKSVSDGKGTYSLTLSKEDFPGACWIKSVSDPFTPRPDEEDVLESLLFEARRTADVSGTWHDIKASEKDPSEAFNTVWQGFDVTALEVPPDGTDSSSGESSWSDDRDFKVTAWCLPQAAELQAYADGDAVRSIATDVVVRCPVICNVSVNANVRYDPKNPVDAATAKTRIRSYVNGLGFVGRLTRSEIVQILKNLGAVSVEMPEQDMLWGSLHDAKGVPHVLSGDALDISSIESAEGMVSKDTVVFAAEDRNIQIKLIPNS